MIFFLTVCNLKSENVLTLLSIQRILTFQVKIFLLVCGLLKLFRASNSVVNQI